MICQEYVFIPRKKKSNQNRKLLGTNKTIQTLREFYPTTNTLLSMSREVSAIRYHARGCCKATCEAPSCVPGELPAAAASEHFKASLLYTAPTVNTLLLPCSSRQHDTAKQPWHRSMSACHFCIAPALPDACAALQLTLRPARCCCQRCHKDLQPREKTEVLNLSI